LGYLQTLRVEVAKRLLETGQVSFEAVSEQVGYRDVGTFRELFKRKTGLSPREYQRRFATAPLSNSRP
jgi:transcriptional regulator GlxA family with amidase domain